VACGNDRQFGRLCEAVGRPELATDPRFAGNPDRVAHRDALVGQLEAALAGDTAAAWEERLTAAGVPVGRVADIGAALDRAGALGLDPLVTVDAAGPAGPVRQVRHPVRYAAAGTATPSPPPRLGEHTGAVRAWLAGSRDLPLPPPSGAS
jgi:crotonobetainyl-CoA:carnitine CoA-transferase CaiB-like acyl-CoA transferase